MLTKIVRLLKNWKWILFRGIFIAALFGFIFAIVFEWLHTPIWIYILVGIILIVLALYADRWFLFSYKELTGAPSFLIDYIDYSGLRQNRSILVGIKFLNRRGNKQIKHIDVAIKYTSITSGITGEITREFLKVEEKVRANEAIIVNMTLRITSQIFCDDAIGASGQALPMPLIFSLEWLVNPIICRISIPENIPYSETIDYSESPNAVF